MATTFGTRPEDTVADSRGNVLSGVVIELYPTEADANARTSLVSSLTSDTVGLWAYSDTSSRSLLWARDPSGRVWPISSEEAIGSISGKANTVDVPSKESLGWVQPATLNDYASLQDASIIAAADGTKLVAAGEITTSSTLTIECDADLSGLTINYTGTGTAVKVGPLSGYIIRKEVRLPKVIASAKTVTGWAQVAGTTGVLVQNCYNVNLDVPHIQNFETGLVIAGYGNGTSYCDIDLGHLDNNKRNMQFTADATGWANQNNIRGGRMSHNSGEGTAASGTRHVLIDSTTSKVNNNNFFGSSLESPNTVEFHLDCAGNDNYWWGCRWENTGTGARVNWAASSIGNMIHGGFGSHTIVETTGASAFNEIHTRARSRFIGDGNTGALLNLENTSSSTNPIIRMYEAGTLLPDATGAAWATDISAQKWRGKRAADTNERLIVDYVNGRIYFGAGNAATTRYIGNLGTSIGIDGASVGFVTDNTYDIGITSLRPRDLLLGRNATVGGALAVGGNVGFYGTAAAAKPTVTGSRGGNAALASLLTSLAGLGLITDSTTA